MCFCLAFTALKDGVRRSGFVFHVALHHHDDDKSRDEHLGEQMDRRPYGGHSHRQNGVSERRCQAVLPVHSICSASDPIQSIPFRAPQPRGRAFLSLRHQAHSCLSPDNQTMMTAATHHIDLPVGVYRIVILKRHTCRTYMYSTHVKYYKSAKNNVISRRVR